MTRQRLIALTAGLFVVGVGIDLVIGYSPIPGYGALIGLVGAFVLILGAKALGNVFVVRSEDLYADEIPPDVAPDLPVAPGADIDAWPDHPVTARADHDSVEAAGQHRPNDHDSVEAAGHDTPRDSIEAAGHDTPRDHDRGAGRD